MPGTVCLMNGPDVIAQRSYRGLYERDKTVESWRISRGLKFLQLWVKDMPDEDTKEKSPFKKGSMIAPVKINRKHTRKKSTKGGYIW